jgi:hypothetical protein
VEASVGALRALEEAEAACLEPCQLGQGLWLAHDDDEGAGDIVGAVPALDAWGCVQGVLEDAGLVAQPQQMAERGRRESQLAILTRTAAAVAASRR